MSSGGLRPCVTGVGVITPVGRDPRSFWEGLLSGKNLLAGPFHPAFRQKVETRIYGSLLKEHFKKKGRAKRPAGGLKKILYNPGDTAYVIGYGRANASYVEKAAGRKRPSAGARR